MKYYFPFLASIILLGFFGMSVAYGDTDCPKNPDWPHFLCADVNTTFEERENSWEPYYDYKGAEWMESKKSEMLDAINKDALHQWIDQTSDQSHLNLYRYYFYMEEVPGEGGTYARYGCPIKYDVMCFSADNKWILEVTDNQGAVCMGHDHLMIFKDNTWDRACVKPSSVGNLIERGWAAPEEKIRETFSAYRVFATLQGDNKVAFLKDKELNAGPKMTYVATDSDGLLVLATSSSSDTVYAFDSISGEKITSIPVGKTPKGVKIHPDNEIAFVANEGSGTISVINLESWNVTKEIPVGEIPHNIAFDQRGTFAYVTLQGEDKIAVIDICQLEVTNLIPVGKLPHNLDLSPDNRFLYVTNIGTNDVAVVDIHTNKIVKRIPVSVGHHGIDVSNNGERIYVTGIGSDVLNVIDGNSMELIKQITVGNGPHGVRALSDNSKIYVGVTSTDEIVAIDSTSLVIQERIPTGKMPFWIAVPTNP